MHKIAQKRGPLFGGGPGLPERSYVPFGWVGLFRDLGAQRPVARPAPGGGPAFFGRKPEERTPGLRPGPGFLWPLVPTRWFLWWLFLIRQRGNFLRYTKTDLGRIFEEKYAGKHFRERKFPNQGIDMGPGIVPRPPRCAPTSPKPSPWGEGAPVRTLGRMRGRSCTQPFLVEKRGAPAYRPNGIFLLLRWATRSPPHPSPPVTASPQGEAFAGGTPPQQNAFAPNSRSRKMRIQIRARPWVS